MILDYLRSLPDVLLVIATAGAWLLVLWKLIDALTPFDDDAELRRGDVPYAIERAARAVGHGIGLACASTLYHPDDRWMSFLWFNVAAAWVTIAALLARPVLDRLLLPRFDDDRAIRHGNYSVALVNAGAFVGLGCISGAAVLGRAPLWWQTAAATVAFYVLGLLFVAICFWLHAWVTPYDLRGRIEAGQPSAGIEAGALIAATSIVASVGVAGDLTAWLPGVLAFALTAALSFVILIPLWYLLVRVGPGHAPRATHEAESPAAAIAVGALLIAAAILVAVVMLRS